MAKKKDIKSKPRKTKLKLEELEVLADFKNSTEWEVLKRWMRRYVTNLRSLSYNLPYSYSAEDFKVRHRELSAQANAFKALIRVVEKSGKKLEEMD